MIRLEAPSSSACEIAVCRRSGAPGKSSVEAAPLAAASEMPLAYVHPGIPADDALFAIEQDEPDIDHVEQDTG